MTRTLRAASMTILAGMLGLLLAVVPSQFSPEQAHAAIAPGVPDPINVLPSVLTGSKSASLAPASFAEYLGVLTHKAAKSPAFWDAVKSVKAGTPSKTEADLVADAVKKFRLPAFKPQTLLKAAGGVGAALTSFDLGLSLGNGALDVIGVSRDAGTLCTGTAGSDIATWWTSNFNHVDCAAFAQMTEEAVAQANSDVSAGVSGARICRTDDPAKCLTLVSSVIGLGAAGQQLRVYLFISEGGPSLQYRSLDMGGTGQRSVGLTSPVGSTSPAVRCRNHQGGGTASYCVEFNNPYADSSQITEYTPGHLEGSTGGPGAQVIHTEADPDRWLECRIKLTSGANLVAQSLTFKESSGTVPPVVCPEIPTGAEVEEFSIWEVGGGQSHELVPTTQTTPEYDHARTTYPECMDGTCMLDLVKADVSCFTVPDACADWYADPDKESTYTCKYGSHVVSLAECGVYAPTFKPGAKPTGQEYADPATGQPLPNPNPAGSAPGGVADPTQPRQCWPTGWGVFNPVEWVQRPVQCVIEWAFVPRQSKAAETGYRVSNAWRATSVAQTIASIESVAPALEALSDGGCGGILVDLSGIAPDTLDLGSYNFLPACPGDFFAPWAAGVKSILAIAIALGGFFSVKAQVSRFVSNGEA